MKIVMISDTHNQHFSLEMPEGDILICAGDFTVQGTMPEVLSFNRWLGKLPYAHKIVIAGNHERGFEQEPETFRELLTNAIYLENSGTEVAGFKVWGSPVTPWNHGMAFNVQDPVKLAELWAQIPEDLDILITHTPPAGALDEVSPDVFMGCEQLLQRLVDLGLAGRAPNLHVFGHIHQAAGYNTTGWSSERTTLFVNACQLDADKQPHGNIVVLDLEPRAC